ncbi:MAG: segregation and condensation protein A [Ruminococcus sp.]
MEQILFRLDTFEGPLDLLLKLISKHKLNIYDIEISKLLEQYMEYLDNSNIKNLESAGEFLEMASRLIYIKTAYLLPKPEADEAHQMKKELETNLIEYSSIKYASSLLAERFQGDNVFVRRPMKVKAEYSYNQMYLPDRLAMAYLNISFPEDIEAENKIIENKINSAVKRKITSVISKVVFILRRLYGSGKKLFMDSLYEGVYDRSERVATFLAVLELTKNGRIKISDDNSEIYFTGRKKERNIQSNGNQ